MTTTGAILLAGGRGTRMGGVAKPLLRVAGATLLQHAIDAARAAGCAPITAVGPASGGDVDWVREDPPFTGPAAAVVTALGSWAVPGPDQALVLACDLPHAGRAVARLLAARELLPADTEGVCLADASGRPQWLTGLYRTRELRQAASALPDAGRDVSMRALLADLAIAVIEDPHDDAADIDTWDDLRALPDA